jgi:uncharacterized protein (TIGR00299 family) protein
LSNQPQPEHWAYFDCFAGISGDMTLGALLDLGLDAAALKEVLQSLGLPGFRLEISRVDKEHLTGVKVEFGVAEPQPPRSYPEIVALLTHAPLAPRVKDLSLTMFRLLAQAEAKVHGLPLEKVHFHELGAADTILDVVGVAFGVEALGLSRFFVSPLPQGWGMIAGAHGPLPNPAPATLELLQGLSVYGTDLPGELVTPTGAVILRALEAESELCPPLILEKVGYGAGSRDLPGHPNLLRLCVGQPQLVPPGRRETVLVLETHLDDMNPELYENLMGALFAAGALDVALTPIQMKKSRPAVRLTVIGPPAARESLLTQMFLHSTTLGVRVQEMERVAARRWRETISTPYGELAVKVMEYGGHRRVLPEYEACRQLAEQTGLPLLEVYRLVEGK